MTLRLSHISKQFGPVAALRDVTFDVSAGEVHALLGENGAGKSTLMQIAYGMLRPDAGMIAVDGFASSHTGFASPRSARAAGIGMVHQHFTSIPALTISENIALAAGWHDSGPAAGRRAEAVVARLGLPLPVFEYVESLSVQLRQRLEIVKALAADASILLLDEPTAVLAPREVDELLTFISAFAARGGAVVLITHKLDEVFRAATRVTAMRWGEVTLSDALVHQTPQSLSRAMIGGDVTIAVRREPHPGAVLVRADGLTLRGHDTEGQASIRGASFDLRAGEIMGVAAIEGSGQRELLRAIAAVDDIVALAGTLDVAGPVGFIPEDRLTEGLIPPFTLAENFLLGTLPPTQRWLDWGAIRARVEEILRAHDVRPSRSDVPAATLSGGNQQKLVLARVLESDARVIVAEDPTRGLDLLATQTMHERLRDAAFRGAAVVVHSSDLDEVLELADRLFVVSRGELRELPRAAPRDAIGDAMLGLASVR